MQFTVKRRLMLLCFSSFHYNFDSEISVYIKESIAYLIWKNIILIQTMTREDVAYLFHIKCLMKQIQNVTMWQIYLKKRHPNMLPWCISLNKGP